MGWFTEQRRRSLLRSVSKRVAGWAEGQGGIQVAERLEDTDSPYWTLTPADAPDGGTISVMLRANEHGPLEVAPANDLGWFERYGCEPSELDRMLDLALYDLGSDAWRSDPYQGLP